MLTEDHGAFDPSWKNEALDSRGKGVRRKKWDLWVGSRL
jgi:hypothetical protein